jgi:WD40 repeat protein
MRAVTRTLAAVVLASLVVASGSYGQDAPGAGIDRLIERLGDDDFDNREDASRQLEKIGEPALEALRQAARTHADAEVRCRASKLVRHIERELRGEIKHFGAANGHYWLNRVAFAPDGKTAIATGGGVIWYDLETGAETNRVMELAYARNGFTLSPDGKYFATGHQHEAIVRLGDVARGTEVREFRGHRAGVFAVAFSPDGKQLVTGGADETIRLWDVTTGNEVRQFAGANHEIRWASFSPDGKRVATGSWVKGANFICLWDPATGKEIRRLPGHDGGVSAVFFTPNGRELVSAGMDGKIIVWDVESGKEIRRMTHDGGVYGAALSPDGKRLLTAGWNDQMVRLWVLASGKELRRLDGHPGRVLGVAFSPDGKRALSSDSSCNVFLWKMPAP